jgi:hypothetical protein
MDTANQTDEMKWLLPAYMLDKPQQPKYSQVSKQVSVFIWLFGFIWILFCIRNFSKMLFYPPWMF